MRKAIEGKEHLLREVLDAAYLAIAKYQRARNERNEERLRSTISRATDFCIQFKPLIPPYKQRYFEILESADELRLSPRDLIMTFDRAIYELHTRMERSVKERESLGPCSNQVLELLDGRRSITPDPSLPIEKDQSHVGFITSGRVVVGGRRVGRVRVIHDDSEWDTVQMGEIVACKMTSPEIVVVTHLLAGVVTEQGGLVCHAAIIAREFNIPCVVGCGPFLSQVQTGQMVELDASNGILFAIGQGD